MLVAAFLLGAGLARDAGQPPALSALLEQAEREFHQGVQARGQRDQARSHFSRAFAHYEALWRQGVNNAALFRNQGNAAFLAGDLPAAILAYRRGLKLDPGNGLLQESLENTRDQVEYPRSDVRAAAEDWPTWLPWPTDNLLLGLATGFYTLGCIALTRWLMIRRLPVLCFAGLVLLLACTLGLAWTARQVRAELEWRHPLVVVKETTPLRSGNGTTYPPQPSLPAVRCGMEGRLQFARGDWLQVEFPGAAVGWLRRGQVLLDTP